MSFFSKVRHLLHKGDAPERTEVPYHCRKGKVNGKENKEASAELLIAAGHGDLDRVKTLVLNNRASLEALDENNNTPLLLATRRGHIEVVRFLLGQGAYIDAQDNDKLAPLTAAVLNNRKDLVELLLFQRASVDIRDDSQSTPLHDAASEGNKEIMLLLLNSNAAIEARDDLNYTPLHQACYKGHLEAAKLLLDRHADIHALNQSDSTPLQLAAMKGHQPIVDLLYERGASIDKKDKYNHTALHSAASKDQLGVARQLIQMGAKIEDLLNQWTPLHAAASNDSVQVATLLLEKGATVDTKDDNQNTPLHFASDRGHTRMISLLVSHQASVNAQNKDHLKPLHLAASKGHNEAVRLLMSHGATVDEQALKLARQNGHSGTASILQQKNVQKVESGERPEITLDYDAEALVQFNQAMGHIIKKDYLSAVSSLKKAIEAQGRRYGADHPTMIVLYHQLGFCYVEGKKDLKFIECLHKIVACLKKEEDMLLSSDLTRVHVQLAYYCQLLGNQYDGSISFKDYIAWAEGAMRSGQMAPIELAKCHGVLGIVYYNTLQMEKAKTHLSKAVSLCDAEIGHLHSTTQRFQAILTKAEDHISSMQSGFELKIKPGFAINPLSLEEFKFEIKRVQGKMKDEEEFDFRGVGGNGHPLKWTTTYHTQAKYNDEGEFTSKREKGETRLGVAFW